MLDKGLRPIVFSFHIDAVAAAMAMQFSQQYYHVVIGRAYPQHYCKLEDADPSIIRDKNKEKFEELVHSDSIPLVQEVKSVAIAFQ